MNFRGSASFSDLLILNAASLATNCLNVWEEKKKKKKQVQFRRNSCFSASRILLMKARRLMEMGRIVMCSAHSLVGFLRARPRELHTSCY